MDYNSNRSKLPLPEYGRNVQNMVDHIMTIEDRDERNRAARTIIDIMGNLYPYLRDINDFKHKLWDHLAIMSDFKLDIDYPYDPPKKETFQERPKIVPYSENTIRQRHYGKTMQALIEKAAAYESGEEKEQLIKLLANHMKKCFLVWNKDTVDDEKIYADLEILSKGRIKRTDLDLTDTKEILYRNARPKTKTVGRGPGKKHRKND
ncbi:DUF4290 domain-containing protein [Sunxiuqinia sp. A32]|uniref:DUF4290 domain-containing protein n=1 Tax=Sunxiuqinia sp. A32 TaxID=3461496 RepID=UPI004045F419